MSNRAVKAYRDIFDTVHMWMNSTTADLTAETASFLPPGRGASAGGHFVHHVLGEDFCVNMLIQGKPSLAMSEFAGRAGFDKPYPADFQWGDWGRTVNVDLDQLRVYAAAVFANTDAYLASLSDKDLDREIDLSEIGWGIKTVSGLLDMFAVDGGAHTGEISAIKGLQGLKGYPF